jgi:hypothetical protein
LFDRHKIFNLDDDVLSWGYLHKLISHIPYPISHIPFLLSYFPFPCVYPFPIHCIIIRHARRTANAEKLSRGRILPAAALPANVGALTDAAPVGEGGAGLEDAAETTAGLEDSVMVVT